MALSEMGERALEYAARGWFVFPIHEPAGPIACACGCTNPKCPRRGKHAYTPYGYREATTNQNQVRDWWERWPRANIGVWCEPSRLVVLDIDLKKDGADPLKRIEAHFGTAITQTLRARSGSGGWHVFFRASPDYRRPAAVLRPLNGAISIPQNVIVEPSLHRSMNRYQWHGGEILDLPEAVREAIMRPAGPFFTNRRLLAKRAKRAYRKSQARKAVLSLVRLLPWGRP